MIRFSLPGLLAAALALTPALSVAQAPTPQDNRAPDAAPTQVSVTQLHEFVAAYHSVRKIRKKLMIETHGMTDKQKIATLKKQAQEKMEQVIRAHLTLGEYVQIGRAVNANPALHSQFMRIRNSEHKAPAPASG
ncbi:MAG: DUF4168 domain-containing protein [Gammaproteobacteria bacterium]